MSLSPSVPVLPDLRQIQIVEWLTTLSNTPTLPTTLRPASTDASFRRYFRIDTPAGGTLLVMDAPPPQEDVRSFIEIGALFCGVGLSVPAVLAQDVERGFLLLSDLGNTTYLQQLNSEGSSFENAHKLYMDAIDALVLLQTKSQPNVLPEYDRAFLSQELQIFSEWYLGKHLQATLSDQQSNDLNKVFDAILANNLAQPQVFIHRDYHSRNLMLLPEGNPGVLDFQGALYGPISYDIVSLLHDVYIQWDEDQVLDWMIRYWERSKRAGLPVAPDIDTFYRDFEYMGLQRYLKILGLFARLHHRDGKEAYLKDIPVVMDYLRKTTLRYRELIPLVRMLDKLQDKTVQVGYTF